MADDSSWTPKQDMSLLCRVCANQHDYLIPIFEGEGLDHDMPTKMDKHLPITVRENDKLPTQMCYQCASTIIAWSELVTNCLEADKKLSRMLKINEKKAGTVALVDEDATSDHYEDAYDDVGGGDDYDDAAADDEDFEKEIKQLISDAGVELGSKTTKAKTTRATTRKRKSETVIVKKESKKSKTDTSVGKSSISLIKPKEEVTASDDRCMIWRCCKCVAKYTSWSHLQIHCLSHSDDRNVKEELLLPDSCLTCQCSMDSHNSIEQYRSCAHCNQVFTEKKILIYHLKIDHCDILSRSMSCWYTCHVCRNKMFSTSASLRLHMQDIHYEYLFDAESFLVSGLQDLTYHCKKCGELCFLSNYCFKHRALSSVQAGTASACREHSCLFPDCHSCQKCEESFDNCNDLWSHMYMKHENSDFVCNLCGVPDSNYSKYACVLERHMKILHSVNLHIPEVTQLLKTRTTVVCKSGLKKYKCPECSNKAFSDFMALKSHFFSHSNEKFFSCQVCEKSFKQIGQLSKHKTFVHGVSQRRICPTCGRSFNGKARLLVHMRIHSEDRPFTCEICGASFKQTEGLWSHKFRHGDKVFICSYCGVSFKHPETLRVHMRKHTESPKHTCEHCGRKFLRVDTLRNHVGVVHNTETPFECSICNESFKIKKELQRHWKTVGHKP